MENNSCPECGGRTVEFKGKGLPCSSGILNEPHFLHKDLPSGLR